MASTTVPPPNHRIDRPAPSTAPMLARLETCERAARETLRALRFSLDDLGAVLEEIRQIRSDLEAREVPEHQAIPQHGLVIESGPCGRAEVA